jgi:predicted transcriptional regulator
MVQLTADIVSAFVTNHKIDSAQLSELIENVHRALVRAPAVVAQPAQPTLVPAVPIKKSVTPDYIVSLEDGRKFKSMRRYLWKRGMTPGQYRSKWGLPPDYPIVAPNYSKARSGFAKSMGLGHKRTTAAPEKKPAPTRKRPVA